MRRFAPACILEFRLFDRLIRMRIRDDVARVSKREDAARQKNVVRRAKDQRPRLSRRFRSGAMSIHDAFFPGVAGAGFLLRPEIAGPGSHVNFAAAGSGNFHSYFPKGVRGVCFFGSKPERVLFAKIAGDLLGDVPDAFRDVGK